MDTLTKPLLHLNGSFHGSLFEGYLRALEATREAVERVRSTAPNQRDYYPLGEEAWAQAQKEHSLRIAALQKVATELQTLVNHCDL